MVFGERCWPIRLCRRAQGCGLNSATVATGAPNAVGYSKVILEFRIPTVEHINDLLRHQRALSITCRMVDSISSLVRPVPVGLYNVQRNAYRGESKPVYRVR